MSGFGELGAVRTYGFRHVGGTLVARDDAILGAIATADRVLTRLDGKWWMGHYDPTPVNPR
jgi:hypothetical protein